jgi:histidyl-tRNA synthetase
LKYSAPRGTQDILPGEIERWQRIERVYRAWCRRYDYREIRTPIFEETDLFARAIGEQTDIVGKEMYTFEDRGGRSVTLRPEGTAPVVRAYVEHKLFGQPSVAKLYYIAPIFRYERPQAGRYRQHHQVGAEAIGSHGPDIDAEVICLAHDFLGDLGLRETRLQINSVGCPQCRPAYREALRAFFAPARDGLCGDCARRLEENPLRVLDCKVETCRQAATEAPSILDSLCPECQAHFDGLQAHLDRLEVTYHVNPRIVRGLDYYTKTAFEILHGGLGAQNQIVGGGRYDGLVAEVGGPSVPAVGFGSGIERILLALLSEDQRLPAAAGPVYVVAWGEQTALAVPPLLRRLRQAGVAATADYLHRSVKAQMKDADRIGAAWVAILGEDEFAAGEATVRNMTTGEQTRVPLTELPDHLSKKMMSATGDLPA